MCLVPVVTVKAAEIPEKVNVIYLYAQSQVLKSNKNKCIQVQVLDNGMTKLTQRSRFSRYSAYSAQLANQ